MSNTLAFAPLAAIAADASPTPLFPATPPASLLESSEHRFQSHDGTEIHYRAWIPAGGFDKIVILLHRGHEHSGRCDETARSLRVPGAAFFAWDQRGHGATQGDRPWAGDFSVF